MEVCQVTRKTLTTIVAAVLLLVAGGGTWWLMRNQAAPADDLYDRTSFLAFVQKSGIKVEKSAGTNTYAWFGVPQESELGIWTNQGFMDVFFFPTDIEATFAVKQTGEYAWTLNGLGQPVEWNTNRTWYFLAHRNAVITTDSQELFNTLDSALNK